MYLVSYPEAGTIIFIYFLGRLRHKGIVSDRWMNGKPMVIANAFKTNGVREISWDAFTKGEQAYIQETPGQIPAYFILAKARGMIGTPYDLGNFNCEHFVEICYGRKSNSTQVTAAILLASLAVVLVTVNAAAQS